MANCVDPEQTAPIYIGAVWSGSTLFASKLNSSVMLGNYLQQTTSADNISDKRVNLNIVFSAPKNRLNETVLLSNHKMCFGWELRFFLSDCAHLTGGLQDPQKIPFVTVMKLEQ